MRYLFSPWRITLETDVLINTIKELSSGSVLYILLYMSVKLNKSKSMTDFLCLGVVDLTQFSEVEM
jgi:hypothetical protein